MTDEKISKIQRTPAEEILVLRVQTEQKNLSDYKFADLIGVPRSTWHAIKSYRIHINLDFLKAISRKYEGKFDCEILQYLREEE